MSAQFQLLSPSILPKRVEGGGGEEPGLIAKQQLGIELTPSKAVLELIHKQKHKIYAHLYASSNLQQFTSFQNDECKIKYMCMYARLTTNTTIQISLFFSTIGDTA